jgi:hypothetical protein
VFFAGEPFLLGGGDNLSIAHQAGGAVVVKGGDAENVHFAKVNPLLGGYSYLFLPWHGGQYVIKT